MNATETSLDYKKETCEKSDCLIHAISLITIWLLLVTVISIGCYYHYTKKWKKRINNIKLGNNFKDIDVKNRTYYFPNEMINIKKIIQKKSRKTKSHTKIYLFFILDR